MDCGKNVGSGHWNEVGSRSMFILGQSFIKKISHLHQESSYFIGRMVISYIFGLMVHKGMQLKVGF